MRKKNLNLVSYFGGKWPHLKWLKAQFPQGDFHFIDALCGAANVALNINYPLVTINDLNDEIINLFEVLREQHEAFMQAIYFTPFAEAELTKCIEEETPTDPLERARRYFVKCQLGYGANGSQNNHKGAGMEFTIQRANYYRVDNWNKKLARMAEIVDKLRGFQILNRDLFYVIDKMDRPNNFIYIDPPYVLSTRRDKKRYKHEWDDDKHVKLCDRLNQVENAMICLSGYDNEIYRDMLPDFNVIKGPKNMATVSKKSAYEHVWTNYTPPVQQLFT